MSLYGITVGKDIKFREALAQAGVDAELVDELIKHPDVAKQWVIDLRERFMPLAPTFDQQFGTPQQLFADFEQRCKERKWDVTEQQIEQLYEQMPVSHESTLSNLLALDIWLGDLPTTFEELWAWVVDVHAKTWRYEGLKSGGEELCLLDGERYGRSASVKWVVLDLTANWDKRDGFRPRDVRNPADSAGLQILSAAALHPGWPQAINCNTVPGVWLPGLQATLPGRDAWSGVPLLYWGEFDRKVYLTTHWDGYQHPFYAVPVFREL